MLVMCILVVQRPCLEDSVWHVGMALSFAVGDKSESSLLYHGTEDLRHKLMICEIEKINSLAQNHNG